MPRDKPNRLAGETSPYLLQHARNPVDWHPWGPEALDKARGEDKPIFLSIGYAACHWCHVMERESFESAEIAAVLNERFVPVKVDREERPDLDEIYMQSVQLLTGQGGWPMSVFLTPEGKPFYAGTYFPPEDRWGRPGFRSLLLQLAGAWADRRDEVEETAGRLAEAVRGGLARPGGKPGRPGAGLPAGAVRELRGRFDVLRGGFSKAPKFPHADAVLLLLRDAERTGEERPAEMAMATLEAMDRGGIHDQAGGGFHRYSTDDNWLVPHFEKMLYDQALLVRAYLAAWRRTGEERWARPVRRACDWVLREMIDEEGGIHSTLDADSEGEEGKFYVWTPEALREVLEGAGASEEERERYLRWYGADGRANFEGSWILHRPRSLETFAEAEGIVAEEWLARTDALDGAVREARETRVRPGKDDKVLACWNGLMIGSLARAGAALGEESYLDAATRAASFVLGAMVREGRLHRSWRRGSLRNRAFLEDYACMAEGLLDLAEATSETRRLEEARRLADEALRIFWDPEEGGFFFTGSDGEALLVRSKAGHDGATPSGSSVMADVLLRLARETGEASYRERAIETLSLFGGQMERFPGAFSTMLLAVERLVGQEGEAAAEGAVVPGLRAEAEAAGAVAPGESVGVRVRLSLPEGWHAPAREAGEGLVPTSVGLGAGTSGWSLEEVVYPPGEEGVYRGVAEITARLRAPAGAGSGEAELVLAVRCQPCGRGQCYPPVEIEAPLNVEIAG